MDEEVVRLDRECLLQCKLVRRVVHVEVEILDHSNKDELSFLPGEGTTLRCHGLRGQFEYAEQ